MKHAVLALGTVCLGISSISHAGPTPTRAYCDQAQIRTFAALTDADGMLGANSYDPDNPTFKSRDYCEGNWDTTPAGVRAVITQLADINSRVAKRLGVDPRLLFSQKLNFAIYPTSMGTLASYFEPIHPMLVMGVAKAWDPASASSKIVETVYVHELGHALSFLENPALPKSLFSSAQSSFVTEGFADLLAINVSGKLLGDAMTMPGCEKRGVRNITEFDGFGFADDFFKNSYSAYKLLDCCEWLAAHKVAMSAETQGVCNGVKDIPKPHFELSKKFSAASYLASPDDYDPHQLGIPVNSFFLAIQAQTGLNALDLLMNALKSLDASASNRLQCHLPEPGNLVGELTLVPTTAADLFSTLRNNIPADKQAQYDQIAKAKKIDILQAITKAQVDKDLDAAKGGRFRQALLPVEAAERINPATFPQLFWNGCATGGASGLALSFSDVCAPICRLVPKSDPLPPVVAPTPDLTALDWLEPITTPTPALPYIGKNLKVSLDPSTHELRAEFGVMGVIARYLFDHLLLASTQSSANGITTTHKQGAILACDKVESAGADPEYHCAMSVISNPGTQDFQNGGSLAMLGPETPLTGPRVPIEMSFRNLEANASTDAKNQVNLSEANLDLYGKDASALFSLLPASAQVPSVRTAKFGDEWITCSNDPGSIQDRGKTLPQMNCRLPNFDFQSGGVRYNPATP